ncbi:DVU0772 family protein [Desulfurispora thermophila]|uniref:DVU0772 family protein n=1 Tax=Desulfurispora thermophila TaxID=265470 RepID=UPI00037B18CF|nr:hypothetical protein [Desulfurispora thermophila]
MFDREAFEKIKDKLLWDFDVTREHLDPRTGFTFAIDVADRQPRLAVFIKRTYSSKSETTVVQPPAEMLLRATQELGIDLNRDGLYNINAELKNWIIDILLPR